MAKNKKEFREELTQQFLSLLESENLNWIKEWSSLDATPINGSSGKQYAGINHFKLLMTMLQHGWSDPRFMTFNQVRKMHKEDGAGLCSVIKGSKGFQVEYWFMNDLKKAFGQKGKFLSFQDAKKLIDQGLRETSDFQLTSRYYTVFHASQIEGITEYNLLQYYIDQDEFLRTKNISIALIDGAHAKVYKTLIKSVGIPVAIITDLDIKRSGQEKGEGDDSTYKQIDDINDRQTTNQTLKDFYGTDNLRLITDKYYKDKNLEVCSQIEKINGFYATSFEEALILTNDGNKILNEVLNEIKPNIYKECSINKQLNKNNSFKFQLKLTDVKSQFANALLFKILTSEDTLPQLPKYIQDAFTFIKESIKEHHS